MPGSSLGMMSSNYNSHGDVTSLPMLSKKGDNIMTHEDKIEYIIEFINATDDGTFESEDNLEWFVFEALYDDFGEETNDLLNEAIAKRERQ